ncbi:MAG: YraN family protein [Clostridia bacterium]|nr:YraN family protein [Clostridia bacterium]
MKITNKAGVWGEVFAARYLRDHGYEIITANFRTRVGEIDLIAEKDGKYMCFIEVKTRGADSWYEPKEAVDFAKQNRIIGSAKIFDRAYTHSLMHRFDVCEVILDDDFRPVSVNYIENAFAET